MLLVIDNYDSFTYNLVHYAQELGAETKVIRNDDMGAGQALSLGAKAVLISPGPKTPDEAGMCLDLLAQAPEDLPILGICLGQQSIGQAFGGKVIRAKQIMHGKVSATFTMTARACLKASTIPSKPRAITASRWNAKACPIASP